MTISSTPKASTVVKTAALLMAVPALLVPMKAAAQQMAANTPNFSRCDQMSATDPKGAISCRVEVLKAVGAAADVRIANAEAREAAVDARRPCLEFLGAHKAKGNTLPPVTRETACKVAADLGMTTGPK